MKKLVFLLLSAGAAPVFGQTVTVTDQMQLGITPVTTNTDTTPVKGPVTYNIYNGPKAGPFTKIASSVSTVTCPAGVTPPTGESCLAPLTVSALSPCAIATAVDGNGTESQPTNVACIEQPSSPGNLTITLIVTVH